MFLLACGQSSVRAQGTVPPLPDGTNGVALDRDAVEQMFGWHWWVVQQKPEPSSTFDVPPDLTETTEPYVHWHLHTGTPVECVASLRIKTSSGAEQFVSGLVVRCDGFVLVPRSAYDLIQSGGTGDVLLVGAEGETISKAAPIAGWEKLISRASRIDYALLKINDHHVRCLPLLAASNVAEGAAVHLVYSVPKITATGETCTAVSVPATIGPTSDHGIHFSISSLKMADSSSAVSDAIPLGAAVVDDDTGAALGIVTSGGGGAVSFTTFARFNEDFTEVGLAPSRGAIHALRTAAKTGVPQTEENPAGGRLHRVRRIEFVPGGPVTLQGAIRDYYLKNFKTDVACTPDFQVDELPTTNAEYRMWLKSSQAAAPPPATWPVTELDNPVLQPDMPVTGAMANAAAAYLISRDERLMTEVEWERASKVKDLRWLEKTWHAWEDIDNEFATWATLQHIYYESLAWNVYVRNGSSDLRTFVTNSYPGVYEFGGIPPEQALADYKIAAKAASTRIEVEKTTASFPRYVHPVGAYDQDVSLYGVRDVVLNAPEMTIPEPSRLTSAYKPFADVIDPSLSYFTFTRPRNPALDGADIDPSPIEFHDVFAGIPASDTPAYYYQAHFWRYKTDSNKMLRLDFTKVPHANNKRGGGQELWHDWQPVFSPQWSIEWTNVALPEFRGAR